VQGLDIEQSSHAWRMKRNLHDFDSRCNNRNRIAIFRLQFRVATNHVERDVSGMNYAAPIGENELRSTFQVKNSVSRKTVLTSASATG